MVSFLLLRPFVKLLQIFSISNATVTCQAEIQMLCAKAETHLSMCPRCLSNRHLVHRQLWHFVNSSGLLSLIKKMFPILVTRVSLNRALSGAHVSLMTATSDVSSASPEHGPVEGVQAWFTDTQMEMQKG